MHAATAYIICGSSTAINGLRLPLVANTVVIFINTMNENAIAMPMAMCMPTPPRIFRDETATPISVIITIAKGLSRR